MSTAISKLNDVVILDTAGRLHIDEELMQELKDLKANIKPHEILLVVDQYDRSRCCKCCKNLMMLWNRWSCFNKTRW